MGLEPVIDAVAPEKYRSLSKAIWAGAIALFSLTVSIFWLGWNSANVISQINSYKAKVDEDRVKISTLEGQLSTLKANLNTQFKRLQSLENAEVFRNFASQNGAGYNPTKPPGRCADGEVIVGLQPMEGGFDVSFQCGKIPLLFVE